jgi:hypothetical protein
MGLTHQAPEASPGEPRQVQPIRCRKMSTPCRDVGAAVATHGPARVLDDVGQDAWHCTVRLVYGVLHGLVFPAWRGDGI